MFVVVRDQSFPESFLTTFARELGCEQFWFRMGRTTFPGRDTNTINFGPNTSYRQVQSVLRATRNLRIQLSFIAFTDYFPPNSVYLSHAEGSRTGLSAEEWARIENATTKSEFDALIAELGIRTRRRAPEEIERDQAR
jgi:hypothetical protein